MSWEVITSRQMDNRSRFVAGGSMEQGAAVTWVLLGGIRDGVFFLIQGYHWPWAVREFGVQD